MKFCLIGCGGIAVSSHGPSYIKYKAKRPEFKMAACCDMDAQRAKSMQEKFGFERYYTDYFEMLKKEKPDAVSVVVSEAAAAKVGMDILKAGFAMLIEKPPGQYSHQTKALADVANKLGVFNQVAFNRRFMPIIKSLKTQADEALQAQKIQSIAYDFYRMERFDHDFSDTAIHGIDTVRFLAGADYEYVRFDYQEMPEYGPGVCNIYMDCVMTNGIHANLKFCPVTGVSLERAGIHGRGHSLLAFTPVWGGYDSPGRIEHFENNILKSVTLGSELCDSDEVYLTNGFYDENEAFFEAVYHKKAPGPAIGDSVNTMLVKECIDRREKEFKA